MRKQFLGTRDVRRFHNSCRRICAGPDRIQDSNKHTLRFYSRRDFTARRYLLPSRLISDNALLVRSIDGKKSVLLLTRATEPGGKEKPARIIFNRYGDRYFLSQAWVSGGDVGRELHPSGAERRLAKELSLAKGDAKSQKVQVAVR